MVRTAAVDRVEQEVEVDEYHALSAALQLSRRFLVLHCSGQVEGFVEIDVWRWPPQVESWATVRLGPPGRSWVDPAAQYPIQELLERNAATVRLIAQTFQQALVNVNGRSHGLMLVHHYNDVNTSYLRDGLGRHRTAEDGANKLEPTGPDEAGRKHFLNVGAWLVTPRATCGSKPAK